MTPNETQQKLILQHLLSGKSITQLEALQLFGCLRLSAYIYNLKHDYGYNIKTELVNMPHKKGKGYGKYSLVFDN